MLSSNNSTNTIDKLKKYVEKNEKAENLSVKIVKKLKYILVNEPTNGDAHLYAAMATLKGQIPAGTFVVEKEFEKAIELGCEEARLQNAIYHLVDDDEKIVAKAEKTLIEFAEQNDPAACYNLAYHYQFSQNKPHKALPHYQKILDNYQDEKREPDYIEIKSHIHLAIILCSIGPQKMKAYDDAQIICQRVMPYSVEAEYIENDVNFKKLLFAKTPEECEVLRSKWLSQLIVLADKGYLKAMTDLGDMYLKQYGENPYFTSERNLLLAKKYLTSAFLQDDSGTAAYLLYCLYTLENNSKLAHEYLKISAVEKGYFKAAFRYGELLISKGNVSGFAYIEEAVQQNFFEALTWEYRHYEKAMQRETHPLKKKRLQVEAQNKLELAARKGCVDAQLIAAKNAMENAYAPSDAAYEERMRRAKAYLQAVMDSRNYIAFPDLSRQKIEAQSLLTLWETTYEKGQSIPEAKPLIENLQKDVVAVQTKKKKKSAKIKKLLQFPPVHKQKKINFAIDETNEGNSQEFDLPSTTPEVKQEEIISQLSEVKQQKVEEKIIPEITLAKEIIPEIPVQEPTSQEIMVTPNYEENEFLRLLNTNEFSIENIYSLVSHLASTENFLILMSYLLNDIPIGNRFLVISALSMFFSLSSDLYASVIPAMFMEGKAVKHFAKLIEYGVLQHLFPMINYSDPASIAWLYQHFEKSDQTFQQYEENAKRHPLHEKRQLSLTFVYGYLLSTSADVSDYKSLASLWCVPEKVKKELAENNFKILIRFIASRYPELNINPYLQAPERLSVTTLPSSLFYQSNYANFTNLSQPALGQVQDTTSCRR